MTYAQYPNRLQSQLAYMIALETAINQKLDDLIHEPLVPAEVSALLSTFRKLSETHQQALETRLKVLTHGEPLTNGNMKGLVVNLVDQEASLTGSTALQIIFTMLNQAIIGYSVLHALSTRFLDSARIADEGTSYHLSQLHSKSYIHAIQQISRLLHDVVLWDLDREGLECQCTCPSCSEGICLCALAGRTFLRDTWVEEGPIAGDQGVLVQTPKRNSAAAKAGLRRGDVILAVNGRQIEAYSDLQTVVRNAKSGEKIRLTVKRNSHEPGDVVIVRS
jgi:PDZ domain